MSDAWLESALSEIKIQIEEIETNAGKDHPDLVCKLERYAALLKQAGRALEAANTDSRAKSLRLKYAAKLQSRQEKASQSGLSTPFATNTSKASYNGMGFGAVVMSVLVGIWARHAGETNPYATGLLTAWFLLVLLALVLGSKLACWCFKGGKGSGSLIDRVAGLGLVLWLLPMLGIVYGSMSLALSRVAGKNQKRNLTYSYICIILALANSFGGIALAIASKSN